MLGRWSCQCHPYQERMNLLDLFHHACPDIVVQQFNPMFETDLLQDCLKHQHFVLADYYWKPPPFSAQHDVFISCLHGLPHENVLGHWPVWKWNACLGIASYSLHSPPFDYLLTCAGLFHFRFTHVLFGDSPSGVIFLSPLNCSFVGLFFWWAMGKLLEQFSKKKHYVKTCCTPDKKVYTRVAKFCICHIKCNWDRVW